MQEIKGELELQEHRMGKASVSREGAALGSARGKSEGWALVGVACGCQPGWYVWASLNIRLASGVPRKFWLMSPCPEQGGRWASAAHWF